MAWADYRCWGAKVAVGGTLALHDVFADPTEGGQAPYDIFCPGPDVGGVGRRRGAVGSLRLLRRTQVARPI